MTSIDEILANPKILKGKIPNDIIPLFQDNPNWAIDTTKKGRNKGKGVVFREVTSEGNFTGRIIQWHPGDSTYHGPDPYWKVSTGEGGTVRIGGENFKE